MLEVLGPLVAALESGRAVAFCQVAATRGSTPQKAGAAMLLDAEGAQVGTLGGGLVEAEVRRKAASRIGRQGPEILEFTLDDDPGRSDGQVCGGRMVILVDRPSGPDSLAYYRAYRDRIEAASGLTEAIAIDPASAPGSRYLFDAAGRRIAALGDPDRAPSGLLGTLEGRPRPTESGGWAFLPNAPRVRLVIIGAGHLGQAVAALAGRLDFEVWVVDDRPEMAGADRFPDARRRIVGPIAEVVAGLEVTPWTYALIATRGQGHDQEALRLLAPTAAPYLGLIGSRRKIRKIFDALLGDGISPEALARVAAPVGLDIGSESVEEIAVSIVAELIARRNRGAEAVGKLRGAGGRDSP